MINVVKTLNVPPEEVNLGRMRFGPREVNAFGACFLPYDSNDKSGAVIRTLLTNTKMQGANYYRNVLTIFGWGFDYKNYAFDAKGRLYIPKDNMTVRVNQPQNKP